MILIGSRALQVRAPVALSREPKDFDYVCNQTELEHWLEHHPEHKTIPINETKWKKYVYDVEGIPCEFEIVTPDSTTEMIVSLVHHDKDTIELGNGDLIPSLDFLFTLKKTHRYLKNSPHFWKNLLDYHKMKMMGAKVRPEWKKFFKRRQKETYNYSHPKLNVKKEDFFVDDFYIFMHDDVHEAICLLDKPAYRYYMKENAEVDCDKQKFFSLPEQYRINGVIEEACVLAIERSLVPHPNAMTPKQAWMFAFMKISTSITSGWFREYAYENAFDIIKQYPEDYWNRFQQAVKDGKVRHVS